MNRKVAVVWDAQLNQCLLRHCSSVGLIGDSLEKTLMLGKIAGGRRRGQKRMSYICVDSWVDIKHVKTIIEILL